jgi:hypothetical protein
MPGHLEHRHHAIHAHLSQPGQYPAGKGIAFVVVRQVQVYLINAGLGGAWIGCFARIDLHHDFFAIRSFSTGSILRLSAAFTFTVTLSFAQTRLLATILCENSAVGSVPAHPAKPSAAKMPMAKTTLLYARTTMPPSFAVD